MKKTKTQLVVVGAGPGGYAAAFYAADMGMEVTLVDKGSQLGGVCLNRGCIPSKALLNAAKTVTEAEKSAKRGITFAKPKIDVDELRKWKNGIVAQLGKGVAGLAKKRNVTVIHGKGYFEDSNTLRVETEKGQQFLEFEKAILAVGSSPALPGAFDLGNPRIMTSTEALDIPEIPKKLLVVGAGYIGMELGTVYAGLGSKVTMVEAAPSMLAGADPDLIRPVQKYAKAAFAETRFNVRVQKMATKGKQIQVTMEADGKSSQETYDRVLVSIGRTPNSQDLGLENTQVKLDDKKFVTVNDTQQTTDSNIYAIGDIAGGILLAHKASKEARIAVEGILGTPTVPISQVNIPAVVFTDPEIAWVGLTETEAKEQGISVKVAKFPWIASGKALAGDKTDGLTKLILEPDTERVLGMGIVGAGAGELIAEGTLAVESGLTAKDLALTVHAHPTLAETVMEAAEVFYGHCTHAK